MDRLNEETKRRNDVVDGREKESDGNGPDGSISIQHYEKVRLLREKFLLRVVWYYYGML